MRSGIDRTIRRSVLVALVLCLSMPGPSTGSEPDAHVLYVAPVPAGRADGSSWSDPASIRRLPELVGLLPAGGEILIRADQGPYHLSKPIVLGARGSSAPVTIRGVDPSGAGAAPLIVGGRTAPYSPETADTGRPGIALDAGADHLSFVALRFQDFGNGCFRLRGAVDDVTISQVVARNVRRFIESDEAASVSGLVVRQTTIVGFSKGAVRLRNDSHGILIEDVVADSQRQDGDVFAMGFHLSGTVHDVVFRRVVAMNAWDTVTDYRNGDGFVAERGTYGLRFEDTNAIDNMDGGYDIKASKVTFLRAFASGNKRNFRIWGSNVVMNAIAAMDPIQRGGGGAPAQMWAGPWARFAIWDSSFVDRDTGTIVFDLETAAIGVATGTIVRHHPHKSIVRLAEHAKMTLNGTALTD